MKKLLYATMVAVAPLMGMIACSQPDDEPDINSGYATTFRMPDAEPMTAEDSAVVAAQQAEYEQNAK